MAHERALRFFTLKCNIFKYDRHPVTFQVYLLLTQAGSNVLVTLSV